MHFEGRVIAFLRNCGTDRAEVSPMLPATNRTQRQSSSDYKETNESNARDQNTSELSSFSEESEVEATPRDKRRIAAIRRRASKRTRNRTSSSEESDHGAGDEISSAEGTGRSGANFPERNRSQHSRGNQPCNSKGSSQDRVTVSRPRTQIACAGRQSPNPQVSAKSGSSRCRHPRQAALRSLENLGDEAWAERRVQRRGKCRRYISSSEEEGA